MTQADAKNAVNSIKLKLVKLLYDVDEEHETPVQEIINDVKQLESALCVRHFIPAPNCRPVTAAELSALCTASNVVIFQPAA